MSKRNLLDDPTVWGTMIAAKFARGIGLSQGNYWEPAIARTLAAEVKSGRQSRDQIELKMAFQLGIAQMRDGQLHYESEAYEASLSDSKGDDR